MLELGEHEVEDVRLPIWRGPVFGDVALDDLAEAVTGLLFSADCLVGYGNEGEARRKDIGERRIGHGDLPESFRGGPRKVTLGAVQNESENQRVERKFTSFGRGRELLFFSDLLCGNLF